MSGIKFELQKEIFQVSKERLHGVIAVNTLKNKKKTPSYLCITGSIERPIRFTIYLVRIVDCSNVSSIITGAHIVACMYI